MKKQKTPESAEEKNKPEKDSSSTGMCLGICIGSGLGILIGTLMDNVGLGLCLGICTGMCVGLAAGSFGRCRNDRALRNRKGTSDGKKKSDEK